MSQNGTLLSIVIPMHFPLCSINFQNKLQVQSNPTVIILPQIGQYGKRINFTIFMNARSQFRFFITILVDFANRSYTESTISMYIQFNVNNNN